MNKKDNHFIKLPPLVRLKIKFGNSKVLIYLIQILPSILISVAVTFLLISGYVKITQTSNLFADPVFSGLFGSLVGACIGGSVGGIISLQLHKESLRATSAIKDKDTIYKVLFDGLLKFRSSLNQKEQKYHTYFTFEVSDPRVRTGNPQFTEWNQIKNDSRLVQMPKWLRSVFERYLHQFETYDDLLDVARADIIAVKKRLIQEAGLNYRVIPGLDDRYLLGVMNKNDFLLQHGLVFEEHNLREVDTYEIEKQVVKTCLLLPSIEEARSFYDNILIKMTDELISILELVIRYINNKYENQDDVI